MNEVKSYFEAINLLENNEILMYKIRNQQITYLTLVKENRIAVFNNNLRYNISFSELKELMEENSIFIFDKSKDIGIETKF